MTLKSRLPLHIYQKYFQVKDSIESFFDKVEVIADSTAILYSIRILIVVIALLMGYVHTPKDKVEMSNSTQTELLNLNNEMPINAIK
jgi:hypothetical protein